MSMRPSPKLRPVGWDALAAGIVIALAVGCGAVLWLRGTGDQGELTAVVSVDGAERERLPLESADGAERTISANGYTLTVVFGPEGVRVEEADCPTQDCVHTGTITRGGQSIVCLPARVIIRLEGGSADAAAPDLVIG